MYEGHHIEGALLVRSERVRASAPRSSDLGTQLAASPVHVAVQVWREEARHGDELVKWVIVLSPPAGDLELPSIRYGRARRFGNWAQSLEASLKLALGDRPAWVVVAKRWPVLSHRLRSSRYAVSLGFTPDNRASEIATRAAVEIRQGAVHAMRTQEPELVEGMEPWWFPTLAPSSAEVVEALVVATDASLSATGSRVETAVGADGTMAVESLFGFAGTNTVELDAISLAIEAIGPRVARQMTVLCDSLGATRVADALLRGEVPQEGFHGIQEESLDRFWAARCSAGCEVVVTKVKGHSGHRLHDVADELARVCRRAMDFPQEQVEAELDQRVEALWEAVVDSDPADWQ